MAIFILLVALTTPTFPIWWPCCCLVLWLVRHRRTKVPRYRATGSASDPHCFCETSAHPRAKSEWVRQQVLYLAVHLTSCRSIAHAFNRQHGQHASVGKSWVAEFIKKHACEIAERRRTMRRQRPAFFAVGHTWALDLTFVVSPDGFTFTVLGIIDHGSRKLLCLQALPSKCVFVLLGHLFLALAEYGLPTVIRTDNESMFTSHLWRFTLKTLGILHHRSPPGQPWRNGRIERLFGTLKPILRRIRPVSMAILQKALTGFGHFYNQVRPHQNLGGLTPDEAWHGKNLVQVQQTHAQAQGHWVQALDGLLVGYHVRC